MKSEDAHEKKLVTKACWVRNHIHAVTEHLNRIHRITLKIESLRLFGLILTRTPTFAQSLSTTVPIRAMPSFFGDLQTSTDWPYGELGKF